MHAEATYAYVGAFVEELARAGIHHVCICPGSRSTPLALLFAQHPAIRSWLHIDERSAAFFALGLAKALREPVALVCTSGTAAANFLPAIIEARYGQVPLLILTADRPHELRDCGAPQAIDQIGLYGNNVKWFVEMAPPEASNELLHYVRTVACRSVATAAAPPSGPVHLNFPFREPLVPSALPMYFSLGEPTRADEEPYTRIAEGIRAPDPDLVQRLATDLRALPRGLIVCGPQDNPELPPAIAALARALDYPILADPLSHVRCGQHDRQLVVDAYDAFLRHDSLVSLLAPEVVLRFGAAPTSKSLLLYLKQYPNCRQILVDGAGGWNDPTRLVSQIIHADPQLFCEALTCALLAKRAAEDTPSAWRERWLAINQHTQAAISLQLALEENLFEGKVFAELARLLPSGTTLYVGNSMPIRDLDTFFGSTDKAIRFLANRGANGIDGVVSSALGARAGSNGSLVLVIGDLSFYHDMNGLLAAKQHKLDATIILLNNDGGGIFNFLPQVDYPAYFEQYFATPHGLDFQPAVEMYGGCFQRVETWQDFHTAVTKSLATRGLNVIEVRTDRSKNVQQHRAVWLAVSTALEKIRPEVGD
jgi:2-succinyl-5-enolpyruvyl-6-hydroxy-3-cyclohexene-1-carboxylate synthase